MRIGFDVTALHVARGGIATYDSHLLRALQARAPHDEFLLLDDRSLHGWREGVGEIATLVGGNARILRCDGLPQRRLARWEWLDRPLAYRLAKGLDGALLWPWTLTATAVRRHRLRRLLDGVDVFHSSDLLLWRQPGALNVVTLYDLSPLLLPGCHTPANRDLQRRKYRFARRVADRVVVPSRATRRDVVVHLGIPPHKVHVVGAGVGNAFRPIRERRELRRALARWDLVEGEYVLHVGTLEPRKNLVRLVEAYAHLRRLRAPAPCLVFAGAPGWRAHEVRRRVVERGLQAHVRFLGWVPEGDLPALYNGAALFVYPSLYEGFGLPPLEALACGVPVIASRAGALPEVVGEAGVLVDPLDVEGLAAAMLALLEDPGRRAGLARRGPPHARRFSWERVARRVLSAYKG